MKIEKTKSGLLLKKDGVHCGIPYQQYYDMVKKHGKKNTHLKISKFMKTSTLGDDITKIK